MDHSGGIDSCIEKYLLLTLSPPYVISETNRAYASHTNSPRQVTLCIGEVCSFNRKTINENKI